MKELYEREEERVKNFRKKAQKKAVLWLRYKYEALMVMTPNLKMMRGVCDVWDEMLETRILTPQSYQRILEFSTGLRKRVLELEYQKGARKFTSLNRQESKSAKRSYSDQNWKWTPETYEEYVNRFERALPEGNVLPYNKWKLLVEDRHFSLKGLLG